MNKFKKERLDNANRLIKLIGELDYKLNPKARSWFFFSKESREGTPYNFSKFIIDNNKIFYIDEYTENRIYPYRNSKWWGFSNGGTLRGLVQDIREWIVTGKHSNGNNGYGGLYCPHWGSYWTVEYKQKVIDFGKEIGFISPESRDYKEYYEDCKKAGLAR